MSRHVSRDKRAIFEKGRRRTVVTTRRREIEHESKLVASYNAAIDKEKERRGQIVGEKEESPSVPHTPDALKDSSLVNADTGLTYRHEHYLGLLMEWTLVRSVISACVYSGTATPIMLMGLANSVAATVGGNRDPRVMLTEREAAAAILRILGTRDVRMAIAKYTAGVISDARPTREKADVMRDLWALRETIKAQYRLGDDEALKPSGGIVGADGGEPGGRA